jgi:hypothetical protein
MPGTIKLIGKDKNTSISNAYYCDPHDMRRIISHWREIHKNFDDYFIHVIPKINHNATQTKHSGKDNPLPVDNIN